MAAGIKKGELLEHFAGSDILSMSAFSRAEIEAILDYAEALRLHPTPDLLRGSLMASCFFEPATRTRLSFEAGMMKLGGDVIGFTGDDLLSMRHGETLYDTAKVLGSYADVLVLCHPLEGAARHAADATDKPVINAGDGANQHPSQTLADLFTIRQLQGRLDDLHVACVGDLRYGRTVHSLVQALAHFGVRLYFVAPPMLDLPMELCDELRAKGIIFSFHHTLESVVPKVDILYITSLQQERAESSLEMADEMVFLTLTKELLHYAKSNLKVLHPLPRHWELSVSVDSTEHAAYFQQAANGLCVRQALLSLVLGKVIGEI